MTGALGIDFKKLDAYLADGTINTILHLKFLQAAKALKIKILECEKLFEAANELPPGTGWEGISEVRRLQKPSRWTDIGLSSGSVEGGETLGKFGTIFLDIIDHITSLHLCLKISMSLESTALHENMTGCTQEYLSLLRSEANKLDRGLVALGKRFLAFGQFMRYEMAILLDQIKRGTSHRTGPENNE